MSNVRTWDRDISDMQYMHDILKLSEEVGHLVHITAKKYRSSYGDKLISMSADALVEGKCIIKSFAYTDEQVAIKLEHIIKTESLIEGICTTVYVWINVLMKHDGFSKETLDKFYKVENKIGDLSDRILHELEKKRWGLVKSAKSDELKGKIMTR